MRTLLVHSTPLFSRRWWGLLCCSLLIVVQALAQNPTMTGITVVPTLTPSTCQKNGRISLQVEGDKSRYKADSWRFSLIPQAAGLSNYNDLVTADFVDILPGQYKVLLSAELVAGGVREELLTEIYTIENLWVKLGELRRSAEHTQGGFDCGTPQGTIGVIREGGGAPHTYYIKPGPRDAAGTKTQVAVTSLQVQGLHETVLIDGTYANGTYTIYVQDACGAEELTEVTLAAPVVPFPDNFFVPVRPELRPLGKDEGCGFKGQFYSPLIENNADTRQAFEQGLFEIGVAPKGTAPTDARIAWTTWRINNTGTFQTLLFGGFQVKEFWSSFSISDPEYDKKAKANPSTTLFVRVKGCPTVVQQRHFNIPTPSPSLFQGGVDCENYALRAVPANTLGGILCYPVRTYIVPFGQPEAQALTHQEGGKNFQYDNPIPNPNVAAGDYDPTTHVTRMKYDVPYDVVMVDNEGNVINIAKWRPNNPRYTLPHTFDILSVKDQIGCNGFLRAYIRTGTDVASKTVCAPYDAKVFETSTGTDILVYQEEIRDGELSFDVGPFVHEAGKKYKVVAYKPGTNEIIKKTNGQSVLRESLSPADKPINSLRLVVENSKKAQTAPHTGVAYLQTESVSHKWTAGDVVEITGPAGFEPWVIELKGQNIQLNTAHTQELRRPEHNYPTAYYFPPGTYTIKYTNNNTLDGPCTKVFTQEFGGVYGAKNFTPTVVKDCGRGVLSLTGVITDHTSTRTGGSTTVDLPASQTYFRIVKAPAGFPTSAMTSAPLSIRPQIQLDLAGEYEVVMGFSNVDANKYIAKTKVVYAPRDFRINHIETKGFYCNGSPHALIVGLAQGGVPPYRYQLLKEDRTPITPDVNMAAPLAEGEVWEHTYAYSAAGEKVILVAKDQCGSTEYPLVLTDFAAVDPIAPTHFSVCTGDALTIVPRVFPTGTTYKWLRNGEELPVTTSRLQLNRVNRRTAGHYNLEVTLPGGVCGAIVDAFEVKARVCNVRSNRHITSASPQ